MIKLHLAIGLISALACAGSAQAAESHHVSGYVNSHGTYVAPHEQTNPNATRNDNYSTRGNTNPYTGVAGTKPADEANPYSSSAPKPADPYAPR